ncbi:hypothetical protein T10_7464, partial [Trichinella papuae]
MYNRGRRRRRSNRRVASDLCPSQVMYIPTQGVGSDASRTLMESLPRQSSRQLCRVDLSGGAERRANVYAT